MEMESDYNARNPRLTGSLEQLFKKTSKDTTLNTLYKVIVNGWPADNRHPRVFVPLLELWGRTVSEKWHYLQRRHSYGTSIDAKGHVLQGPCRTPWWRIEQMYGT